MSFFTKIWKLIDTPKKLRRKSHQVTPVACSIEETVIESNRGDSYNQINSESLQFVINEHNQVVVKGSKVTRTVSVSRSGRYKTKSRRRSALNITFNESSMKANDERVDCDNVQFESDKDLNEIEINFRSHQLSSSSDETSSQNSN